MPGPIYIYKCTKCNNYIFNPSWASGGIYDARYFSDSKRYTLLTLRFPIITKCKQCSNIFWINKQKELAIYNDNDVRDEKHKKPQRAKELKIDEFFEALEKNVHENNEEEFYIRKQIWWSYNDRIRIYPRKMFNSKEDEQRFWGNNMRMLELIDILLESDNEPDYLVIKAEINRNLGHFDKCMSIIETLKDLLHEPFFNNIKVAFEKHCKNKNKALFEYEDY